MLQFSVIAREFRVAARKKRAHGLRLVFGVAMAVWFCVVALKAKLEGAEALGRAVYEGIVLPLAYGLMLLSAIVCVAFCRFFALVLYLILLKRFRKFAARQ